MTAKEYGVFRWDGDNRYRRENAVKVYKYSAHAEKFADKLNTERPGDDRGYVVRSLLVDRAPDLGPSDVCSAKQDLTGLAKVLQLGPKAEDVPVEPSEPTPERAAQENEHVNKMIMIDNWIKDQLQADDEKRLREFYAESQFKLELEQTMADEARDDLEKELRAEFEEDRKNLIDSIKDDFKYLISKHEKPGAA